MSKKIIMKHNNSNQNINNTVMDIVAAVLETKSLYITSNTASRIKKGLKPTLELIEEYTRRYPDFQLTVNDLYYIHFLGCIPA